MQRWVVEELLLSITRSSLSEESTIGEHSIWSGWGGGFTAQPGIDAGMPKSVSSARLLSAVFPLLSAGRAPGKRGEPKKDP